MSTLIYGTSADLTLILQNNISQYTLNDRFFQSLMSLRSVNKEVVEWEQEGNYVGLTSGRVSDGPYGRVKQESLNAWSVSPGRYGDEKFITEKQIEQARQPGTFGDAIDLTERQGKDMNYLSARAVNRIKKIGCDLFATGIYQVTDGTQIVAGDQFALVPFTVATPWSNYAASTPLLDLRNAKLRHRGQSASFGRKSELWLNSQDVNNLLSNTNPNDLGAKRVITSNAGGQPMSLTDVNRYFLDNDLPQIVEYDDFWIDESNNVNQFIAQGYGFLVGARDQGDKVSEFIFTRNAATLVNPDHTMDGAMSNIYVDFDWKVKPAPHGISTLGFNGAPAFYYPSAIVPFRC